MQRLLVVKARHDLPMSRLYLLPNNTDSVFRIRDKFSGSVSPFGFSSTS
jgi:hypothetical protein